jgi:hypothetical protein
MKNISIALSISLLLGGNSSAFAKTASGTIPVSIQLVNGSTVGAYLTAGDVTTVVQRGYNPQLAPSGAVPIVRVNFELQRSWFLVKRVTWDKYRKHLTIDF